MNIKQIKHELQNLISGKSGASYDALIQAVTSYLRSGKRTSPMAEEKHQNKAQETEKLIDFAKSNIEDLHDENVLTCNGLFYFIDTVFFINPDKFWD